MDLIKSLYDDRLRKECLSLPMSTDTLLFYDSLRYALKRLEKAEKSLMASGFQDLGGELWKPPVRPGNPSPAPPKSNE